MVLILGLLVCREKTNKLKVSGATIADFVKKERVKRVVYLLRLVFPSKIVYTSEHMVITHHGGQCFKVTHGDTTLVFDPVAKASKRFTPVKFGADIAVISMRHPDFNGVTEVTYGDKVPFVINGPGEYEVGDVTVRGFGILTTYDGKDRYVTVYQIKIDGMTLVFLGALPNPEALDSSILGELGDIDVLFVPIGGDEVLEVPQASKLAVKLEARCVIPMHFDKSALQAFLQEESAKSSQPVDKVTLKKKDVATMTGEIVVLQSK